LQIRREQVSRYKVSTYCEPSRRNSGVLALLPRQRPTMTMRGIG